MDRKGKFAIRNLLFGSLVTLTERFLLSLMLIDLMILVDLKDLGSRFYNMPL